MLRLLKYPKLIVIVVLLLTCAAGYLATNLKISFTFEQFFPEKDEDLEFYKNFIKEFEKDDNFILIALKDKSGDVFNSKFLNKVNTVCDSLLIFKNVRKVQSLTNFKTPYKTPFGYTLIPTLHINDEEKIIEDKLKIENDEKYIGNFINDKKDALTILIKTEDELSMNQNDSLIFSLKVLLKNQGFNEDDYHILGKSFFQTELVRLQKKEVLISTLISALLVFIILYLIYGKLLTAGIAMIGIGSSLVLFMGLLSALGRELSVMAALYPVLILIVGSSDVIHLISKYLDNDINTDNKLSVMITVLKEVGMATLLTSATTAVGFATLLTSQLKVIKDFGINAALGVMIAYVVIMVLIPCLLLIFTKEQLYKKSFTGESINNFAQRAYNIGFHKPKIVLSVIAILVSLCLIGVTKITTDYKLIENLPKDVKVTDDFLYFEKEFSGFRPFEVAVIAKPPYKIDDFEVIKMINRIDLKLKSYEAIKSTIAITTIFKSLNMIENGNNKKYYVIPDSIYDYTKLQPLFKKVNKNEFNILINNDYTATRISCRIGDIGADKIKVLNQDFEKWISKNIDPNKLEVKRTGTSLILDKNGDYITSSIFKGLLLSIILISMLMALIVKNWKMLIVSLIPNIIPLLFAGALLGYFNIELEAGISIIFAVIFGIAVDDTIHFIARYNQCMQSGLSVEESIAQTFKDTGKALVITTIILFFGFLVMLFSNNPASVTIGVLIAFTLISALLCDLYLLPILIRKVFGKNQSKI